MAVRTFATSRTVYCVLCRCPANFTSRVLRSSSAFHASVGYCKESPYKFLSCQCSYPIQDAPSPGSVKACLRLSSRIWQGQFKRATSNHSAICRPTARPGFTLYSLNTRAYVARCGLYTLMGRVSEVSRSGPATSNTAAHRRSCVVFPTLHIGGFRLDTHAASN